jgi:hypothetical protein
MDTKQWCRIACTKYVYFSALEGNSILEMLKAPFLVGSSGKKITKALSRQGFGIFDKIRNWA